MSKYQPLQCWLRHGLNFPCTIELKAVNSSEHVQKHLQNDDPLSISLVQGRGIGKFLVRLV